MKILQLTPGTGHFYCGSCLRDNALALALRARGHDAMILPLYLPFALEQGELSDTVPGGKVHLGGINMYLQHKLPVLGRLPGLVHDALDKPSILRWVAARGTMTEPADLGPLTVSTLKGDHGRQRSEVARLAESLAQLPKPDVVLLSNVMLAGLVQAVKAATGAPLVCTLQGEVPFLDGMVEPYKSEAWNELRAATAHIDGYVPVSNWYGEVVRERLDLDPGRIHPVHNGIDPADFGPWKAPKAPTIGYLARMHRPKGLHTLIDAFLVVKKKVPNARLRIAGVSLSEDKGLVTELKQRLAWVADSVEWLPNVDREQKLEMLRELSVLSVPATYGESFGLYLLEAWASGVPVVQPRSGAFPELLESTGAGLLVEPDDVRSLANGLVELLTDEARARELGEAGRAAVQERFTLDAMAAGVEAALEAVLFPGRPSPSSAAKNLSAS
ncbi:MAG: glycosyltransferase family 4 protein [Planctomycetota bacterium]|nr:glycosyltransferase family 4 protein [Planctomycetota bacterium]